MSSIEVHSGRAAKMRRRGSALLAVMWLSAALAAIAFAVAISVRGEVSRAETTTEGVRAYYLAQGAIDRAINYISYGPGAMLPNGRPQFWDRNTPLLAFQFPEGAAVVEIIPETSRLNVNGVSMQELLKLLMAMGVPQGPAGQIAMAIIDWRTPGGSAGFDAQYLNQLQSFRAPHSSLLQIEDLLSVAGVTPDLFYGRYERTPSGVVRRAGLRDCLTVYSAGGAADINTVEPEVMVALGAPPAGAIEIERIRRRAPIYQAQIPLMASLLGPAAGRVGTPSGNIYTLKATGRVRRQDGRLSDLRRSVATTIRTAAATPDGIRILRRYENASGWSTHFDIWPQ